MPKLDVVSVNTSFGFSGVKPEQLKETEYTLVTICVDMSGSVSSYYNELIGCLKEVIKSCKRSAKAENLLIRVVQFNDKTTEVHGFKLLKEINIDQDYQSLQAYGYTALFDGTYDGIESIKNYGNLLIDQDFNCNAVAFIITDGDDNKSKKASPNSIKSLIESIEKEEKIESLVSVLIGINTSNCKNYLDNFKNDSGITQFIDVGSATESKLAKLAAFISKSIASQSQSLGTGKSVPAASLTF